MKNILLSYLHSVGGSTIKLCLYRSMLCYAMLKRQD